MDDWKSLRPFLGLSRSYERKIIKSHRKDYGEQKFECLGVWKDMKGKEATYEALINAAEDANIQSLADSVRAMRKSKPPPDMEGVYVIDKLVGMNAIYILLQYIFLWSRYQ